MELGRHPHQELQQGEGWLEIAGSSFEFARFEMEGRQEEKSMQGAGSSRRRQPAEKKA